MSLEVLHSNRVAGRPGLNGGSFPTQKLAQDDLLIMAPTSAAVTAGRNLAEAGLLRRYSDEKKAPLPLMSDNNTEDKSGTPKFIGTLNLLFGNSKQSLSNIKLDGRSLFSVKRNKPTPQNLFSLNNDVEKTNYFDELTKLQNQFFNK